MNTEKKAQNKLLLGLSPAQWAGLVLFIVPLVAYYGFLDTFHLGRNTIVSWLASVWKSSDDYGFGWMVYVLSAYMMGHAAVRSKDLPKKGSVHGMWLLLFSGFMLLASVRTLQPRLAQATLPFLCLGCVWYYWGRALAWRMVFPCCFTWLGIPLPSFQQATVGLQLIATNASHLLAGLAGVETIVEGTNISSATQQWDAFSVAGGCSGIRSLVALMMMSFAWAYLAEGLQWWKRAILALSAIPLAIVANVFRVTSIFVCAEYITPAFASKTWHDWSGLMFFFPASLLGLFALHSLLAGEILFFRKRKVVVRMAGNDNGKEEA